MDTSPDSPTPEASDSEVQTVRIHFAMAENMPARLAHHMIVQPSESEVVLSFFEILPPFLRGVPDPEKMLREQGVKAICVARIAVPYGRYTEFVGVMQDTLQKIGHLAEEQAKVKTDETTPTEDSSNA